MSNLVTTGQMANMAAILAGKLGRKVHVHRVEYSFRLPSGKFKKNTNYTLVIEGSHPPMFPGLTVNEVKGRMAMLTDLLYSGVIVSAREPTADFTRAEARNLASSSERADGLRVEGPGAPGDTGGLDQSSGSDDRY